jgi:hypothetical protein
LIVLVHVPSLTPSRPLLFAPAPHYNTQKMLARENMVSLSAAFTEGTRAESKIALRKARNQASIASAAPATYTSALPPAAASAAKAAMANFSAGAPVYVMQPVMSAGDKYRLARLGGAPTPILGNDAVSSAANTATGIASVSTATAGSSQYMFLLLGLGVGTAAFVSEYTLADVTGLLGLQKAAADAGEVTAGGTAATTAAAAAGGSVIATSNNNAHVNGDVSHAPHTHRVQEQQPLWLQRSRRL